MGIDCDLREAETEEKQSALRASHIPDRSQFAVKQGVAELRSEVKQNIAELKSDLMRWQWVQLGVISILLTALHFIPFAA